MSANGKTDRLTPKQEAFLSFYIDIKSETFGNAYQSAMKAGYEQEYAKTITAQMPDWLSDNIRRLSMLSKAERNLDEALDNDDEKMRFEAGKFVAETVGKRHYSKRTENKNDNTNLNYTKDVSGLTDEELKNLL